jgi:hypothetical protein
VVGDDVAVERHGQFQSPRAWGGWRRRKGCFFGF